MLWVWACARADVRTSCFADFPDFFFVSDHEALFWCHPSIVSVITPTSATMYAYVHSVGVAWRGPAPSSCRVISVVAAVLLLLL